MQFSAKLLGFGMIRKPVSVCFNLPQANGGKQCFVNEEWPKWPNTSAQPKTNVLSGQPFTKLLTMQILIRKTNPQGTILLTSINHT